MCLAPKVPTPTAPPPPPTMQDAAVRAARTAQQRRQRTSTGYAGMMAAPDVRARLAATPATAQAKTLLGG